MSVSAAVTIQFQIKLTRQKLLLEGLANQGSKPREVVKVTRRFLASDALTQVVAFVKTVCGERGLARAFDIISPYPRRVLFSTNTVSKGTGAGAQASTTLAELQIENKSVLYVHPVDLD